MFEESTVLPFEAPTNLFEIPSEVSAPPSTEPIELSSEVRSKSAREISEQFGVSDKTVQTWYKSICAAYPWIEPEALKTGKSAKTRYTPLCQSLIAEYRTAATELSEEDWIASVHAANVEKLAAIAPATSSEPTNIPIGLTEVMPPLRGDRPFSPAIDRTAARSLVPAGTSYLSALEEEEWELQQLETQELELLGRMNDNFQRLSQNQAQWQRTNDLRRQRLLRQTRLEAAALATELEAEFDETLRESQHNLRSGKVGKPSEISRPQLA
jgi:hypothetical protein